MGDNDFERTIEKMVGKSIEQIRNDPLPRPRGPLNLDYICIGGSVISRKNGLLSSVECNKMLDEVIAEMDETIARIDVQEKYDRRVAKVKRFYEDVKRYIFGSC